MLGVHSLSLFIASGLVLNMLPGPDSLLIMTRSATQGWRAGSAAALGIGAGTLVHIFAAALGLSALLVTSFAAFAVIKWIGAAYIVYIGIGMLRASMKTKDGASESIVMPSAAPLSFQRIFLQGFLTNILNPKVALFFLAFVPQFISVEANNKPLAFIFLGLIFNINGMIWCHCLALFTDFARQKMTIKPALLLWLSRVTGGLFIALGLRLALAKQN